MTVDAVNSRRVFAEVFRRYGLPTSLPPEVDPASVSSPYPVHNYFPDIYCDYVETDKLNAIACIHKGRELVAIFSGLINFFSKYFCAFLSDPKMFLTIGDPSKDLTVAELNAKRLEFMKQNPTSGFAPLSRCPIRSEAMLQVMHCSTLFIHLHEVAHIQLGHLDLLIDDFGIHMHEELPIVPLSQEESDLKKALELQADQSASLTSLHLFRKWVEKQPENKRVADADLLWSIAVDSLFVLFELAAIEKGSNRSLTHPDPYIRWTSVQLSVGERAEEHGIRPLQLPETESLPVVQVMKWLTSNGFVEQFPQFPFGDEDKTRRELYSTWEGLLAYTSKLERYQELRGSRLIHHV